MIVDRRELNSWKIKYEHGDYQKIELISGIDAKRIGRAMRTGRMYEKTYNVLRDYFSSKIVSGSNKKQYQDYE